jgi:hypothetical protein
MGVVRHSPCKIRRLLEDQLPVLSLRWAGVRPQAALPTPVPGGPEVQGPRPQCRGPARCAPRRSRQKDPKPLTDSANNYIIPLSRNKPKLFQILRTRLKIANRFILQQRRPYRVSDPQSTPAGAPSTSGASERVAVVWGEPAHGPRAYRWFCALALNDLSGESS